MSEVVLLPSALASAGVGWLGRLHQRIGLSGMVATGFLLCLAAVTILAPIVAPYGPNQQDLLNAYSGPSASHLLGTDELGRDLLSRLIWGARSSLLGPLIVIGLAAGVGVPLAATSAWCGGKVDAVISRLFDFLFAFPGLLLAILVVALYGPGLVQCAVTLSISYMPWIARVVRSGLVRERNKTYISALNVQGQSGFKISSLHLIPNVGSIIWSQVTISFGYALVDLAALSFLGLNVQPPRADWGVMVNDQTALLQGHPAEVLYACAMIVLVVTAVTYVGNRLASDVEAGPR